MGKRLEGKSAIVTGAGSGIGRASAQLFAAEGARVLAMDVADSVEETRSMIEEAGGTALAVQADAGNEEDVRDAVDRCKSEFGSVDVIYANAGISGGRAPLSELDAESFQQVLRVNLVGPMLAAKHASRHMIVAGKGSIVFTASVAALRSHAGSIAYSASKAGVVSLVQTIASELRGTGIRVNAICPGLIETGMTKPIFDWSRSRGTEHRIGQLNPTRRYGNPGEIAAMALFLASDDASYVNGQAIAVDGGLSSSHPFVPPRDKR